MPHLILLGDSIFDNGRYTKSGPDVVSKVRQALPSGWDGTLLAVDGSTTADIAAQLERLPKGATHLVLSVGGNDALMRSSDLGFSLFGFATDSKVNPAQALAKTIAEFAVNYRLVVSNCLRAKLPLFVCTIYNCCFPDETYQQFVSTGLALFNDVILKAAIENRLPVLDLRRICIGAEDYANPIEPSSVGGQKIAEAIVGMVLASNSSGSETRIFTGGR